MRLVLEDAHCIGKMINLNPTRVSDLSKVKKTGQRPTVFPFPHPVKCCPFCETASMQEPYILYNPAET